MTVLADLTARFRADTSDLEGGLERVNTGVAELGHSAGGLSGILGGVSVAGAAALGLLVDKVAEATFAYNTFNQQALITFSALEGGQAAAQAQIEEIDKLSVSLGINREQMSEAAKMLQLMTDGAHNNEETLTKLANAADATGQPINYLAQRFGYLFQQLEQGGGSASYAARSLQLTGVITAETAHQLKAMAESGASSTQIWDFLISSLDKFNGAAKATTNTWEGLKASIHDTFEIDFGRAFAPIFTSLNKLLAAVRDFTDSPLFDTLATKIASGVGTALGPIDRLTTKFEDWFHKLNADSVDRFLHKLEELSGTLGATSGLFAKFGADLLSRLPILHELLGPIVSKFTGLTGAVLGFLIANKDTRDALVDLLKAFLELAVALAKAGGGFTTILNGLAPIAAAIIETAAAIVHFVATTGPLLAMVEAVAKLYIAWKIFEALRGWLDGFTAKLAGLAGSHATAAAAATTQAAAEERLSAALAHQATAAEAAAAANRAAVATAASNVSVARSQGIQAVGVIPPQSGKAIQEEMISLENAAAVQTRFTGIQTAIGGAATKAQEFGTKLSNSVSNVLPVLAGVAIAWQIVSDKADAAKRAGEEAFNSWAQHTLSTGTQRDDLQSNLDVLIKKAHDTKKAFDDARGAYNAFVGVPFTDAGYHIGKSQSDVDKLGGFSDAASKNLQKAKDDLKAYNDHVHQIANDLGIPISKVEELAFANKVNLVGSVHDAESAIRSAMENGGKAVDSLTSKVNELKGKLDLVASGLKGAAGQPSYTFPSDLVGSIPPDLSRRIDEFSPGLLDRARAIQGVKSETADYAAEQMRSFDKGTQEVQLRHQQIQAAEGYQTALHSLAKAHQAYADAAYNANKAVEMAQRSLTQAQESYNDAVKSTSRSMEQALKSEQSAQEALTRTLEQHARTQETNANAYDTFRGSLLGINHEYTDMVVKVHDLSQDHRWMGDIILSQIAILNNYKDALEGIKRTYDNLGEQSTILQDRLKSLQNTLNHPLQGTSQYDDLLHQNKMAQDAIQLQIDELLGAGHYSREPQIEALQTQLNQLKNAADQLNLKKDLDIGDKQYQLDKYAKTLTELPFTVLAVAAKNFGELSAQQRTLQERIDALKPSIDLASKAYNDQKTKVDALVNSLNTVISTDQALKQDQFTVRDAYDAVAMAIRNVSDVGEANSRTLRNAAQAVADAQRNLQETFHQNAEAMANAADAVANAQRGVRDATWAMQDAHNAMTRASLQNDIDRVNAEQRVIDQLKAAIEEAKRLKDAEDAARLAARDTGAAFDAMRQAAQNAEAQAAASAQNAMNNILQAQGAIGALGGLPPGARSVPVMTTGGGTMNAILYGADGGILQDLSHFDSGGFSRMEDHSAAIYSAKTPGRLFAEPETGGEAYIPLSVLKRGPSLNILSQVAEMFGQSLIGKDSLEQLKGLGTFGGAGKGPGPELNMPSWPEPPSASMTTPSGRPPGATMTIESGAVKVEVTVEGDAPANLRDEISSAIEDALLHVSQAWTARVGVS